MNIKHRMFIIHVKPRDGPNFGVEDHTTDLKFSKLHCNAVMHTKFCKRKKV